jgi:hypothetical protein
VDIVVRAFAVIAVAFSVEVVKLPSTHLDVPHIQATSYGAVATTIDRVVEVLAVIRHGS